MANIKQIATEVASHFKWAERRSGDRFYRLKGDAPRWVWGVVRDALDEMPEDDWRYAEMYEALRALSRLDEYTRFDEARQHLRRSLEPEESQEHLIQWLASDRESRNSYVNRAATELSHLGYDAIYEWLSMAQYLEQNKIIDLVLRALEKRVEELERLSLRIDTLESDPDTTGTTHELHA